MGKNRLSILTVFAVLLFSQVVFAVIDPNGGVKSKKSPSRLSWDLDDNPPEPVDGFPRSDTPKEKPEIDCELVDDTDPTSDTKSSHQKLSSAKNVEIQDTNNQYDNNLYEGVPMNSKKPTMVKLTEPLVQKSTVAKYDGQTNTVECPYPEATGQFVYPPDCTLFVNCHQGRPSLHPCSSGTLFSPETLECDYPSKVKCYVEDVQRSVYSPRVITIHQGSSQSNINQQTHKKIIQKIECPAGHNGMLPHPETCKKFLQCERGGTFIMDCGPGTVFNPKISVCDWPYNVPGCSDDKPTHNSAQDNHGSNVDSESSDTGRETHEWNSDRIVESDSAGRYHQSGSYGGNYHGHGTNQQPNSYGNHGDSSSTGQGQYHQSGWSSGHYNGRVNGQIQSNQPGSYAGNSGIGHGIYNTKETEQSNQGIHQTVEGQYDQSKYSSGYYNGHGAGQAQRPSQQGSYAGHSNSGYGTSNANGAGRPSQGVQQTVEGQYEQSKYSSGYYNGHGAGQAQRPTQQGSYAGHSNTGFGTYNTNGAGQPIQGVQQTGNGQYEQSGYSSGYYNGPGIVNGQAQPPNQQGSYAGHPNVGHGTYNAKGAEKPDQDVQQTVQFGQSPYSGGYYNGQGTVNNQPQRPSYAGHSNTGYGTYNANGAGKPIQGVQQTANGQYDQSGYSNGYYSGQGILNGQAQPPNQEGSYAGHPNVGHGNYNTKGAEKPDQDVQQTVQFGQGQYSNGYYNGQGTVNGHAKPPNQNGNYNVGHGIYHANGAGQSGQGVEGEENLNYEQVHESFGFENHGESQTKDQWPSNNGQSGKNTLDQWQSGSVHQQTQYTGSHDSSGQSSYNHPKYGSIPVYPNGGDQVNSGPWNNVGNTEKPKNDDPEIEQESTPASDDQEFTLGYHHEHGTQGGHQHQHHHHHHHPHRENENWHGPSTKPDGVYPVNDRKGYGRTNTDFSNPGNDGAFLPTENAQAGPKLDIFLTPPKPGESDWQLSSSDWHQAGGMYGNTDKMRPSQPVPKYGESGVFVPSSWRGHQEPSSIPKPPSTGEWNEGVNSSPRDKKLDEWSSKTNIIQHDDKRKEQDIKMDTWNSRTNIFKAQQGNKHQGIKTSSRQPPKNGPSAIYVTVNGTKGHYITRDIEVNQGHSNTRNYGRVTSLNRTHDIPNPVDWNPARPTYPGKYEPIRSNGTINRWKPTRYLPKNETRDSAKPSISMYPKPNHQKYPNKPTDFSQTGNAFSTESPLISMDSSTQKSENRSPRTNFQIELPTVSIGDDYGKDRDTMKNDKLNEMMNFAAVVEPDVDKYEIEVLDKESWKPKLPSDNKKKKSNVDSMIMRVNKNNSDVEILDFKLAPWHEEEIPFPVYYIAPVHPLGQVPEPKKPTPATGQILRLRGGSSPRDGYLEVQGAHPGWGIVCDSRNGWSLNEAHVVCRQLGYTRGAEMAWQGQNKRGDNDVSWIAATKVDCKGNETKFQTCKFVHGDECVIKRDAVGIRCMPNRLAHCRTDEIAHEGQCYHLAKPESGLNHAEASDYCTARKSQLIDITTQRENDFISEWLNHDYPRVNSIMTSGIGFTTFNRTLWIWEDSNRAKFQFNKWWPGWENEKKSPPSTGSRPACIIMKKQYPCHYNPKANCTSDYFFWDVEDCATSMNGHSWICERPYDDISCVYGKGQVYAGNANVTASGKKCLPWKHQSLFHAVRVNVLNLAVRDKLMTHNFCRNPNPMKESRPWCFIDEHGEREHCDIPHCGEIGMKRSPVGGKCKPKHFECMPGECIPSPWVCDGEEDCTNGIDEMACSSHLGFFKKMQKQRLDGHDVEKWMNTAPKACALRCKEADFTCRSFSHKSEGNICFLSDTNVGSTGDLVFDVEYDYYEMIDRSVNCDDMFSCDNRKCVNRTKICDGKNDCGDRSDEKICTVKNLDYAIRLAGSNDTHEGRVEVKILGLWGQVCDDGFGMIDADVVCKELGFGLGALEVTPGGYFGNMEPADRFMVDQLKCRGNETSIRECDFDGWGVHNCLPEEAVGVVCKSAVNKCKLGHWKCDTSPLCIPTAFICDDVVDCPDKSDESPVHCDAPFELRLANGSSPLEGRVEVRHHGVWGTVCDDDFTDSAAKVICNSLGYGGSAVAKKNRHFGAGDGPIWLDEVFCHGNETQLYKCEHNHWGRHNCDHEEDVGVICTEGPITDSQLDSDTKPVPEVDIGTLLPSDCGRRPEDFGNVEDEMFQRIVRGSIAPKGSYPWQASIRIRGHSQSSHACGAVVISPLHVLTAAHCLEGYNKGTYFVRAGDYNSKIDEGTEVEANIEDYYIHEDFRKGGPRMNNDIALVLLKGRGIPLGENIMPICLPSSNVEYSPGLNCTISGFGSIATGQSAQSLDLRYGWIPLLDQTICRADYVYGDGSISDGMVCAGFLDEGVDACGGDSGGPLACQSNGAFTLYGVTSWGHHCGKANKPGVYVRIAHYRDWIDKKIRESLFGRS